MIAKHFWESNSREFSIHVKHDVQMKKKHLKTNHYQLMFFKDSQLVIRKKLLRKALITRDILAHNIAIKRYCDKNIILSHRFLLCQGKLWAQGTLYSFLSSPWLGIETLCSKMSFYCDIFLSQYCVPKCLMWVRP